MKKPNTNEKWAEEAFLSYKEALKQLEDGTSPVKNKLELFRHAPILAALNREISGTERGIDMLFNTVNSIENDFKVDDEAQENYLFYFILAYIQSHTYADYLGDLEADKIMDYMNDNYQLFKNT